MQSNRLEGVRCLSMRQSCGTEEEVYPARGPFEVSDRWGMGGLVCLMLICSLDPGKNAHTIQYETMRKLRLPLSNFVHTCPEGLGDCFLGEEGAAGVYQKWFRRFMKGCHRRMGDVWMPDCPVSIHKLKACLKLLEKDWDVFEDAVIGRTRAGTTACILIAGLFTALREEEIVRLDLGAMRKHWDEAMNWKEALHVPLMLAGRYKKEIGEPFSVSLCALIQNQG